MPSTARMSLNEPDEPFDLDSVLERESLSRLISGNLSTATRGPGPPRYT